VTYCNHCRELVCDRCNEKIFSGQLVGAAPEGIQLAIHEKDKPADLIGQAHNYCHACHGLLSRQVDAFFVEWYAIGQLGQRGEKEE